MSDDAVTTMAVAGADNVGTRTAWRFLTGYRSQVSTRSARDIDGLVVDGGSAEPAPCYLVGPRPGELNGSYHLRTRLLVEQPTHAATVSTADLLLNTTDLDTTYLARFRIRNGVRYFTLTKRKEGRDEELVDDVISFDFDRWLSIEISFVATVFQVLVDGRLVATCAEFAPLTGGSLGFGAEGVTAGFGPLEITRIDTDRALTTGTAPEVAPRPVRVPGKKSPCGAIEGEGYRVEFTRAVSESGATFRSELYTSTCDGQWLRVTDDDDLVILTGSRGSNRDLLASLVPRWVSFTGLEILDDKTARLTVEEPGVFTLSATWSVSGRHPRVRLRLVAGSSGHHVIGLLGFASRSLDVLEEVFCGPLQHAKMVRGVESIGLSELSAPFCLVQHTSDGRATTVGLFVPADQLSFEYEPSLGDGAQPLGMSLRNHAGRVQPILYAPQLGERSWLEAGNEYTVEVGLYARQATLFEAYRELLRTEYGYGPYRSNVFDSSLTDTMHNIIDLLASGPDDDDSIEFRGSPSGWWSRAKGFIDIENDQAVRATTTSVLLSAYYLTADDQFYENRALPTIEYHLSRNGYGWTPKLDRSVYGDPTKNRLCSVPFGTPSTAPLYTMTRGGVAAARRVALHESDTEDYWLQRAPMSAPLAAYRMTRDPALLRRAEDLARQYIAAHVSQAYVDNVDPHHFQNYYSKAWIELLEMFEETGDRAFLDAAHKEARRFVTQVFVRPVPDGSVKVPVRPLVIDRQIDLAGWWDPQVLYDYPDSDVDDEEVPSWVVSPNGLSFEALKTYRFNGFTQNPAWAPSLLRLAHHTGDDLLRDVAHNAVVGRFTNYPGYYYRQYAVNHMKPDFPYRGPFGNTTIYYHHAPAQLGLVMDYLLTEHETRSNGQISFPAEFEQNYVWFSFRVRGHRPGRFCGYDQVWLWMPRGIVSTGNPQINWVSARGRGRFFVSLTSESDTQEQVDLRVNRDLVPWEPGRRYAVTVVNQDRASTDDSMVDGLLRLRVPPKGVTAVIVHGLATPDLSLHREPWPLPADDSSFHFDDASPVGSVRGILIPKPDGSCYHAYIQAATEQSATLHYSTSDSGPVEHAERLVYPNEWTIRVDDVDATFTFTVQVGGTCTDPVRLRVRAEPC